MAETEKAEKEKADSAAEKEQADSAAVKRVFQPLVEVYAKIVKEQEKEREKVRTRPLFDLCEIDPRRDRLHPYKRSKSSVDLEP